jgi:hypothetical protein
MKVKSQVAVTKTQQVVCETTGHNFAQLVQPGYSAKLFCTKCGEVRKVQLQ